MPDVSIEGVGTVRLDDSFLSMSPAQQQAQIEEIKSQASRSSAPETTNQPSKPRRSSGQGGWNPTVKVVKDGRAVASSIYPGVRITQVERDPNSALGRANPSSWHNHTNGAIDVDADSLPEGMTFDQYIQGYKDAGFSIVHSMNEDETRGGKRSGHATGNHWHVVLGPRADGTEEVEEIPNPEPEPAPEAPTAPGTAEATTVVPTPAPEEPNSFFRMPSSMDELGRGLMQGVTPIVQGALDLPAILANPVNTLLQKAGVPIGNDLAGDTTSAIGLPENNTFAGSLIRGASGGLTGSLEATALSKLGAGAVSKSLATLGSTPVRDAIAGSTANAASNITGQLGGNAAAQMLAGVAGGSAAFAGGPAISAAKNAVEEAGSNRWVGKEVANNPQAPFHAEVAADIAAASKNEGISATAAKRDPALVTKVLNNVEREYTSRFSTLINQSKLPQIERERLKEALELKYSLSPEKIEALRGTPQGDAVADGILKTQAIRKMTEPHQRGAGGVVSKLANGIANVADLTSLVAPIPGGPYVSQALRKLGRATGDQEVVRIAQARDIVKKAPRYAKLGEQVGPSGAVESKQGLWDAAEAFGSERTAATAAAQAAREAKLAQAALARKEAMQRKADNARVGVINDRDNIIPGGGFRGLIYEKTGLDPVNQDIGIQTLRQQGKITPEQYTAFLESPDKLMSGNAGNAIMDRFAAMADAGKLQRSPKWSVPEPQAATASPAYNNVDAKGNPIRSNPAYEAGVQKNIARQLQMEKELDELDPIQATFADGGTVRRSDSPDHGFDPDTLARITALRSALAAMGKTPVQ